MGEARYFEFVFRFSRDKFLCMHGCVVSHVTSISLGENDNISEMVQYADTVAMEDQIERNKIGRPWALANRNFFPKFCELWSGLLIPCCDMHQSFTDALAK